ARVHLDGDHAAVFGIDCKLDVAAAGFDADLADDGNGRIAHALVFLVGQRLYWGHRDRIAGVHAHRIEVFDGADDDDVVGLVAHHLQLESLPADDRFLDQDFADRTELQATANQFIELVTVIRDASAGAT